MTHVQSVESGISESAAPERGWIVPAVVGIALLMQSLSATVIVNALPAMARTFGENPVRLNLAITIYMLSATIFLPLSSWIADRFGAKRVLMLAMALYACASAGSGFAQNLPQVLLARFCEGAAGAMMVPVGRMVLLRTTPRHELVGALAVLTMPILLGPVLGPLLGGAIITFFDWRWIFFLNLPVAAIGVTLVRMFVPNVKEQETPPLDVKGLFLTGFGLAGVVFGFEGLGGRSILPPALVLAMFVCGLACLGFYVIHARTASHPAIDLSAFRTTTFRVGMVGGLFPRIAAGAWPFLLAMLLQVAFGMSAFAAGLLTFISAAGALAMKAVGPPVVRRFGFRSVLMVNGLIAAATYMAAAFFTRGMPHLVILLVLAASGFFRSLQFTCINGLIFLDLEQHQMSRGATAMSMSQQLSQSIGVGMSAALLRMMMDARGEIHVTAASVAPCFIIMGLVWMLSIPFFAAVPRTLGPDLAAQGD